MIVFRKTVVGDWRFYCPSGRHLQSQVKSRRQMMVVMPPVLVLISQFCRDVIGRQNMKVVVTGQLSLLLFSICLLFGFVWGHVWVVCKVQVAVDISSEVLVPSLCTSFLLSLLVVCAVSDAFSRVPVNFVFSYSMVFRNVIPDITVLGRSFVFSQSRFQVACLSPRYK